MTIEKHLFGKWTIGKWTIGKMDIWKIKNIQHSLVQRGRLVSGWVQKVFVNANNFKLELLGN